MPLDTFHVPQPNAQSAKPRVALFVTCLVDVFRPSVGFAAVKLLEAAGCAVSVPTGQTCCGQPAYNSGDKDSAKAIALNTISALEGYDYVVVPSGSCAGMLKVHFPDLLSDDPAAAVRAKALAGRVHELVSFLVNVRGMKAVPADLAGTYAGRVTYHDSCAGLRELGIKTEPRTLLASMPGVELVEMHDTEVCCGFGGTFSVKYPDISNAMVEKKTTNASHVTPDLLLAGDLGCLMNMAGKLERIGSTIGVRHIAEVLAGELASPPISKPRQ
ncbi:MAG: (Fe-S)-binding protein [Hyphomicrobium aestuarii]|nr:(Fe-S)-binding protein [Hyphomicrobium aestuarii]